MNSVAGTIILVSTLLYFGLFAEAANPCGFRLGGATKFPAPFVCAATLRRPRVAFSSTLPKASCPCPKILKPVCCRVNVGNHATITVTRANDCLCNCIQGAIIFDARCHSPPLAPAGCFKIFRPVCCYIAKFDLTVTAGNSCVCRKNYIGVETTRSFCGLKNSLSK